MPLEIRPHLENPSTLADFTAPGLILPSLRGRDVASVIQELSQVLQREGRVRDLLPFYEAALNREFLVSTDMESGMAIPHARLPGLMELSFALGRSEKPMVWSNRGGRPVRIVLLLAVPATDSTQYLLLISGLARLLREEGWMERLQTARGTPEILEILQQAKLRVHSGPGARMRVGHG